jgi:hypothetical protein
MREIRQSGSMSGRWKRSMVELVRHRQTKGPVTDRLVLNHRATSRLYIPFANVSWQSLPIRSRSALGELEPIESRADRGDEG